MTTDKKQKEIIRQMFIEGIEPVFKYPPLDEEDTVLTCYYEDPRKDGMYRHWPYRVEVFSAAWIDVSKVPFLGY